MKKLSPKKMQKIFWIFLILGALIGYAGVAAEIELLSLFGMLVIFLVIIFRIIFYRCPHCGKFLDRSTGDFCPYCGKKMNESMA